jgi:hypothetical protein
MATVYTVVGQHRTVPSLLLLLGDDNRYYARSRAGRTSPIAPTADWAFDSDGESGLDSAAPTATPVPVPAHHGGAARLAFRHSAPGGGVSWSRPLRALAIGLVLVLGMLLGTRVAFAHAPGLATTTADITLHEAPSADSPVLTQLPVGTEVELTGAAEGEFLEVTVAGQVGWTTVDGLDGIIDTAPVILDASLRAAPTADGEILGAVQAGSTVILTGASVDGFLAASFAGTGGWLPASAVA